MVLNLLRLALVAGVWSAVGLSAQAQNYLLGQPQEPYANYYVGPDSRGLAAQLYPTPLPTPAWVGHTYVTYPALAPQEFMYHHQRTYLSWKPESGWTRTKVVYGGSELSQHLGHFLIGRDPHFCNPPLNNIQLRGGPN